MPLTSRRFALDRAERLSTGVAAGVSTAAYVTLGQPYLARGVVGDLAGLGLLAVAGLVGHARVRHEAAVCLAGIGVVVVAAPQWPLRYGAVTWWVLFGAGLSAYLLLRRGLCDVRPA